MKKIFLSEKFNIAYSACALILAWLVWIIAYACKQNDEIIPSFSATMAQFFALFTKPFFWKSFGYTLLRTLYAFALSFVLALACACVAAIFKPFAAFMRPIAAIFRTLPTMAVLLLILVWFAPRTSPVTVVVAFLVLFPMMYSQLYGQISGVDGELKEMAKVYKLTRMQKLKCIYLPHIMPSTVINTGTNLSFGLKLIISAEIMVSTYTAIGGMMSESQIYGNTPRLAALTLVAVLFGIIVELVFRALSVALFKWKRGAEND